MSHACQRDARQVWVLICSRCTAVQGANVCLSGWDSARRRYDCHNEAYNPLHAGTSTFCSTGGTEAGRAARKPASASRERACMVSSSGSRIGRMLRMDCRMGSIAAATAAQISSMRCHEQCTHWSWWCVSGTRNLHARWNLQAHL